VRKAKPSQKVKKQATPNDEIDSIVREIARTLPNESHKKILLDDDTEWHSGWIKWRRDHPKTVPKLSGLKAQNRSLQDIDLRYAILHDANFWHSDLYKADFSNAECSHAAFRNARLMHACFAGADVSCADFNHADASNADFRGTNLYGAALYETNCTEADFRGSSLAEAVLPGAILSRANLSGLDLRGAELQRCVLVGTDLRGANISGAKVYGISAWDVKIEGTIQQDLIITPDDEPTLAVDSLELAQFMYLLLRNKNIRHVIDTITSKVVLILGRFTPDRKAILDALRDELRRRDYLPVLFDFEKPSNRDITETVSTLAHMARFVVADITDAKSIPQELMRIVPALPSVPVQPLLLEAQREYGMFEHFRRFPWVLEPFLYEDQDGLLAALGDKVIAPAESRAKEQIAR
jgi:uncharacterized protein YjbI with pentapeptide repeats